MRSFPADRLANAERNRAQYLHSVLVYGEKWNQEPDPVATFKEVILNLTDQREIQKQIRRGIFDGLFDLDVVGAVRTPGVKKKYQGRQGAREVKKFEQEVDEHDKLTPAGATAYRAVAARCNYLSQDRPDISFAAKELCRDFAVPSRASMDKLKRMAKYLACVPRVVFCFPWQ